MAKVKKKLNLKQSLPLTAISDEACHVEAVRVAIGLNAAKGKQKKVTPKKPAQKKVKKDSSSKTKGVLTGRVQKAKAKGKAGSNGARKTLKATPAKGKAGNSKKKSGTNVPKVSNSATQTNCMVLPQDEASTVNHGNLKTPVKKQCLTSILSQSSPTIDELCQYPSPEATDRDIHFPTISRKINFGSKRKKSGNFTTPTQPRSPTPPASPNRGVGEEKTLSAVVESSPNPQTVSMCNSTIPASKKRKPANRKRGCGKRKIENKNHDVKLCLEDDSETHRQTITKECVEEESHCSKGMKRSRRDGSVSPSCDTDSKARSDRDSSPPADVTTPRQPKPSHPAASPNVENSDRIELSQSAKPGEVTTELSSDAPQLNPEKNCNASDNTNISQTREEVPVENGISQDEVSTGDPSDLDSESRLSDLDDDDELPEAFSSCSGNRESINKGDVLWVKTQKYPFWPAVVKNTYTVKKKLSKVTVVFIGVIQNEIVGANGKPKGLTVAYNKRNIIPYGRNHEQHTKLKNEGLQSELAKFFETCMQRVEDFVFKKATGETTLSSLEYFREEMALDELEEVEMTPNLLESVYAPPQDASDSENKECPESSEEPKPSPQFESPKMSKALVKKVAKSKEYGRKIVENISTPKAKKVVFKIYKSERPSDRHKKYMDRTLPPSERNLLKYAGFGPVTDDSQRDEIMDILVQYWLEMQSKPNKAEADIDYITSVWVPEAIIFAMTKIHKYGRNKAERYFEAGPRFTKEEHKRIEREIMANKDSIDAEARERYDRKISRNVQMLKSLEFNFSGKLS